CFFFIFFFFSSRRRHTRFDCDWSSDVCSSDLLDFAGLTGLLISGRCCGCVESSRPVRPAKSSAWMGRPRRCASAACVVPSSMTRSEERRVGKECRGGGGGGRERREEGE